MGTNTRGPRPGLLPQGGRRLVVTEPSRLQGTVYEMTGDYAVVGRKEGCDIHLDDDTVSRTHAALQRSANETGVIDLSSRNGTTVNGEAVSKAPRTLQSGDVIRFGNVEVRFHEPGNHVTQAEARQDEPHYGQYKVDSQVAAQLNNVARDQHNAYVQHIRQERASFAREIAATKTKASRLIWLGFIMWILGGGAYLWGILGFAAEMDASFNNPGDVHPRLFGPDAGGIPIGLIGFAIAFIGTLVLVVGIVLHVVAAARRRRLEESSAAPWNFSPPPVP